MVIVDNIPASPITDQVYLLQEFELDGITPSGLYKIGFTTGDTLGRMKQYKAGNGRKVIQYYVIEVRAGQAQAIEATLHRHFASKRLTGEAAGGDEWFKLPTLEDVQEVIRYMGTFDLNPQNQVPMIAFDLEAPVGKTIAKEDAVFTSVIGIAPEPAAPQQSMPQTQRRRSLYNQGEAMTTDERWCLMRFVYG